jgi:hypothetical protein
MKLWKSLRNISAESDNTPEAFLAYTQFSPPTPSRHLSVDRLARRNQLLPEPNVSEPLTPPPPPSDIMTPPQAQLKSPTKITPSRKDTKTYYSGGSEYKSPVSHSKQDPSKSIHPSVPGRASVDAFLASMDWQNQSSTSSSRSVSGPVKMSGKKKDTAK